MHRNQQSTHRIGNQHTGLAINSWELAIKAWELAVSRWELAPDPAVTSDRVHDAVSICADAARSANCSGQVFWLAFDELQ